MGSKPFIFGECATEVRDKVQPEEANGARYIGLEHIEQGTLHLNGYGSANDVSSTKSKFSKGDILFGKLRPYFRKVVRAPFDGVCSTDIWVVRSTNGIDQGFLYYWMASQEFVDFSMQGSEGTKMPRAKWNHVSKHQSPFFSEEEQKAIAHILGSLDDKIELNRRMNKTLEAMAQALFKSWFVDFDPVIDNALAAGNEIPEELKERAEIQEALGDARKPLPEDSQNLFPSEFEHTEEMGWIPKGWEVSTVGEEFDVTMGQSPPGSTYNETGEGIPFFQGRADFGFRYPSERVYCTAPKRFAEQNDTLVSVRAPVGDVNMALEKYCIGRGVGAVRHKSFSRSYTYYSMLQLREHFNAFEAEGTVFGSISQKDFKALKWLSFDKSLIKNYEYFAGQFDEKIEGCYRNILILTTTRDTLLPKLLSGEIRIPEADKLVEGLA